MSERRTTHSGGPARKVFVRSPMLRMTGNWLSSRMSEVHSLWGQPPPAVQPPSGEIATVENSVQNTALLCLDLESSPHNLRYSCPCRNSGAISAVLMVCVNC